MCGAALAAGVGFFMVIPLRAQAWKSVPQGLKPSSVAVLDGTAKAVPFVKSFLVQRYIGLTTVISCVPEEEIFNAR
jgi:hypothetical protein